MKVMTITVCLLTASCVAPKTPEQRIIETYNLQTDSLLFDEKPIDFSLSEPKKLFLPLFNETKKTEFETDLEYKRRLKEKTPQGQFYISSPAEIFYSPEHKQMVIGLTPWGLMMSEEAVSEFDSKIIIGESREKRDEREFNRLKIKHSFKLQSVETKDGFYVGQNAFGVEATVHETQRNEFGVEIKNFNNLPKNVRFWVPGISSKPELRELGIGFIIQSTPSEAKAMKESKDMKIILGFKISDISELRMSSDGISPTISRPVQLNWYMYRVPVIVNYVAVYNDKTKCTRIVWKK